MTGTIAAHKARIAELEAQLAALSASPAGVVKPLEWKTLVCCDRHAEVADSVLGRWEMWSFPNGSTHIMKPGEHQGSVYEDTPEEAKAYIERVYQRRMAPAISARIMSAIEPAGVGVETRERKLEDALPMLDHLSHETTTDHIGDEWLTQRAVRARKLATSIRAALKGDEQ